MDIQATEDSSIGIENSNEYVLLWRVGLLPERG